MSEKAEMKAGDVVLITDELALEFADTVIAHKNTIRDLSMEKENARQRFFERIFILYPELNGYRLEFDPTKRAVIVGEKE